jgi:hypothetical protein
LKLPEDDDKIRKKRFTTIKKNIKKLMSLNSEFVVKFLGVEYNKEER